MEELFAKLNANENRSRREHSKYNWIDSGNGLLRRMHEIKQEYELKPGDDKSGVDKANHKQSGTHCPRIVRMT